MEEEGHRLHRGLQQAQGERGPQVAGDGIRHQGSHADMDEVVAARFHQHGLVLAGNAADVSGEVIELARTTAVDNFGPR